MRTLPRPRKPAQRPKQERTPDRQLVMLAAIARRLTTIAQTGERDDSERPPRPKR